MDSEQQQFQLRYTGARFDGHRLPVDMLADLPAFRDLVAAFAKQIWRQTHMDRVRVPKGFDKGLALDLVRIDPGSAMPTLVWDHLAAQRELPGVAGEFALIVDQAYGLVINLFDKAANDEFPRALSSEFIRPLNKFGAALHDDERIEFWGSAGAKGNVVYLDTQLRRRLITKVRETYETRIESSGVLTGIDAREASNATLRVKTYKYGTISIEVPRDRIKAEFDGHIDNAVQFDITVELSSEDAFKGVVAVHDIVLVEFPEGWEKLNERFTELSNLRDNWLDGKGKAISGLAVASAMACVLSRPILGPLVKAFPTEVGGVLLEFEFGGWDLSLEFFPDCSAETYGIEIDGDGAIEPQTTVALSNEFFAALDALLLISDE